MTAPTAVETKQFKHLMVCVASQGGFSAREIHKVYRDLEVEHVENNHGDKHIIRTHHEVIGLLPSDGLGYAIMCAANTFAEAPFVEEDVIAEIESGLPAPSYKQIQAVLYFGLEDGVAYAQRTSEQEANDSVNRIFVSDGSLQETLESFGLNKDSFGAEDVKKTMKADLLIVKQTAAITNMPANVLFYREERDFFYNSRDKNGTVANIVQAANGYFLK